MDPFEEFEFKPLTEGLGFHKKADKLKADMKTSNLSEEKIGRSIPEKPAADILDARPTGGIFSKSKTSFLDLDDETDLKSAPRPASKSISDLIAALPPSLDFLEDGVKSDSDLESQSSSMSYPFLSRKKKAPVESPKIAEEASRPMIFQPLGREDYAPPVTEKIAPPQPTPKLSTKPTVSHAASVQSGTLTAPGARPAQNSPMPPAPTFKAPATKPIVPAPQNTKLEESYARAFPHIVKNKQKEQKRALVASNDLQKASAGLVPALLDAMAVLGVSTIFLVIIIMITQIDIVRLLSHATTNSSTHVHLGLLFLCVMQLYMLSARSFFGATLGEWAFDMQLGTAEQQNMAIYPLKVVWRMCLVLATGIITLPLLSKLFGRDLLADLGAPQLYVRPE